MKIKKLFIVSLILGVLLGLLSAFSSYLGITTAQRTALIIASTVLISASYVYLVYSRMMKDRDFKKLVLDERDIMIKEKTS